MLSLLLLAMLGSIVLARPTRSVSRINARDDCVLEEKPWIVTNIVSFSSSKNNQTWPMQHPTSFISFDVHDRNKGLKLKTSCFRQTNTTSAVDPDNYYLCDDIDVEYKFLGDSLQIARRFKNECLGEPPYDQETAFGRANTTLKTTVTSNGTLATQTRLIMPISSLA